MKFFEKMAKIQADRSWTVTRMSRVTGLPRDTVKNYVHRDTMPLADNGLEIARTLDVDFTWLFDESRADWPPPPYHATTPVVIEKPVIEERLARVARGISPDTTAEELLLYWHAGRTGKLAHVVDAGRAATPPVAAGTPAQYDQAKAQMDRPAGGASPGGAGQQKAG